MKKILLTGHELVERAAQLGVSIYRDDANVPIGTNPIMAPVVSEYEIQRRVIEAERHISEHKLWIIAVISTAIALISAFAAWAAVISKSC
ncbi:MAG: hypothetical protein BVN34_06970 [Proteobacteria bacterium ST_bin12]|nr:MAG: hypothetical protein BVN34_06970 [Proteobacteria bacterium ST_bin12]